jgi:hypothetical protein
MCATDVYATAYPAGEEGSCAEKFRTLLKTIPGGAGNVDTEPSSASSSTPNIKRSLILFFGRNAGAPNAA